MKARGGTWEIITVAIKNNNTTLAPIWPSLSNVNEQVVGMTRSLRILEAFLVFITL